MSEYWNDQMSWGEHLFDNITFPIFRSYSGSFANPHFTACRLLIPSLSERVTVAH